MDTYGYIHGHAHYRKHTDHKALLQHERLILQPAQLALQHAQ